MASKEVLVPVSIGELLDKITILRIKEARIADAAKLVNIKRELKALEKTCTDNQIDLTHPLIGKLQTINEKLWVIEDDIRDKERSRTFDAGFIELARAVYVTNDQRFEVKRELNQLMGSAHHEEKSYKPY